MSSASLAATVAARAAGVTFAIGLSFAAPAVAAADTSADPAPANQTSQANDSGRGTARSLRPTSTADHNARSTARIPAAAATTPIAATGRRQPSPTLTTPTAAKTTSSQSAVAVTKTVVAGTETDTAATAAAQEATPATLTAAATPMAHASVTADWFSATLAPVQSFLEGISLLVRRALFNQAPTVHPVQTTGQLDGAITGTIGAVDPEGDALSYAVTETPKYGSVVVSANGSYVYTPGANFTGVDSFNIAVTDTGLHINLMDLTRPASTQAFLQVAQNKVAPTLTFNFVYGSGAQYWSADARRALQNTAMLLSSYITVKSPTTIVYNVTGESSAASTLASAGSDLSTAGPGFFSTVVQAKIQTGVDANGSAADGIIAWNFANPWIFGSTVASSQYDFTSTALHELLHTLGFMSSTVNPGTNTGRSWTTFDKFLVTANGTAVISDSFGWKSEYDANLTGGAGGLYFGGPNAVAAYGGVVPLYTPTRWASGSSVSHLDDSTFAGSKALLMNAVTVTGQGIRVLSPVELGILKDLGYTITNPSPVQALILLGFGFLRRRSGRGQRPVN